MSGEPMPPQVGKRPFAQRREVLSQALRQAVPSQNCMSGGLPQIVLLSF